jgi:hypothetical protein
MSAAADRPSSSYVLTNDLHRQAKVEAKKASVGPIKPAAQ